MVTIVIIVDLFPCCCETCIAHISPLCIFGISVLVEEVRVIVSFVAHDARIFVRLFNNSFGLVRIIVQPLFDVVVVSFDICDVTFVRLPQQVIVA